MITIKEFSANPSYYVWLDKDGDLVLDSQFKEYFLGDIELLMSCIEDNIKENSEGQFIDYPAAIKDYEISR